MGVQLTKDSIDLGIVVRDADAALAFYRDTLGFEDTGSMKMPGGGGTMYRLLCGTSLIKIVHPEAELDDRRAARRHPGRLRLPLLDDLRRQPRRGHRRPAPTAATRSSSRSARSAPA